MRRWLRNSDVLLRPYTIRYSTPVFHVNAVNGDDSLGPAPSGRNNAIRLKAGESIWLAIAAGNYETPIRLAWYDSSAWLDYRINRKEGLITEAGDLSRQGGSAPYRVRSATSRLRRALALQRARCETKMLWHQFT